MFKVYANKKDLSAWPKCSKNNKIKRCRQNVADNEVQACTEGRPFKFYLFLV